MTDDAPNPAPLTPEELAALRAWCDDEDTDLSTSEIDALTLRLLAEHARLKELLRAIVAAQDALNAANSSCESPEGVKRVDAALKKRLDAIEAAREEIGEP